MKNQSLVLSGLLLSFYTASCFALTPYEQAFQDGQATAAAGTNEAVSKTSNTSVNATIGSFNPTYYNTSGTSPEAALFGGGTGQRMGAAKTAGTNKATSCQNDPPNSDAFLQQNCAAINFMQNNPNKTPLVTISPTSPLITNFKAITSNPTSLAANAPGFTGSSAGSGFTACTPSTTTTPAVNGTEVCNNFTVPTSQSCTMGQTVAVNANTNYQCNQTNNAFSAQTCTRQASAVVTPTYSCSISGGGTGLGSMSRYGRHCAGYRQVYYRGRGYTYVGYGCTYGAYSYSYPYFDVVFGCDTGQRAKVSVTLNAAVQYHSDALNSSYYPITLDFVPGHDAGPITSNFALDYQGFWWETATISYKGATNTVTISMGSVTATAVPSGTAGMQNVITASWVDGCTTQEAAAK